MNKKALTALMGLTAAGIAGATTITGTDTTSVPGFTLPEYDNQILVTSNVGTDTTWSNEYTYILTDDVYVTNGAALTIEAGTVVRGYPTANADTDTPGALLVAAGSKIYANGTASDPIIFTDMWDNNVPGMTAGVSSEAPLVNIGDWIESRDYSTWQPVGGKWGSVIILGATPAGEDNTTGVYATTNYVEGLPEIAATTYGAGYQGMLDDDDSSGIFKYVSLRYGGYPLSAKNEINGLTMGCVGRGTELHHVEVINNIDDGYEWFGGTVNAKYLVAWSVGDDSFDVDQGFRGKNQFCFSVQGALDEQFAPAGYEGEVIKGSGFSDKGMELDGVHGDDAAQPYGTYQFYNVTIVGKGLTNAPVYSTVSEAYDQYGEECAVLARDSAGAQIYNSVFMDFAGAHFVGERKDDKGNSAYQMSLNHWYDWPSNDNEANFPNAELYQTQTDGYMLELADNVFYNFVYDGTATNETLAKLYDGNEDSDGVAAHIGWNDSVLLPADYFTDFTGLDQYDNVVASSMPIASLTRTNKFVKNIAPVVSIDPLAANDALTVTRYAPNDGFYTPVGYKGAFGSVNWLENWTCVDTIGLIEDDGITVTDPTETIGLVSKVKVTTQAGVNYRVEASTDNSSWVTVGYIKGDGEEQALVDTADMEERMFYRVVAE